MIETAREMGHIKLVKEQEFEGYEEWLDEMEKNWLEYIEETEKNEN